MSVYYPFPVTSTHTRRRGPLESQDEERNLRRVYLISQITEHLLYARSQGVHKRYGNKWSFAV